MASPAVLTGDDGVTRCAWGDAPADYRVYHDTEWGRPVTGDVPLFEKLCLEGFQSGLSWLTILRKRESFREAFAGFDFARVAAFGERDVDRLLGDASIIRHRGKIEATINNARRAVELVEREGSLSEFVWGYAPPPPASGPATQTPSRSAATPLPVTSPEATALAKELKRRGWRFVGPVTVYSFMQAMGMVNDHHPDCAAFSEAGIRRRG